MLLATPIIFNSQLRVAQAQYSYTSNIYYTFDKIDSRCYPKFQCCLIFGWDIGAASWNIEYYNYTSNKTFVNFANAITQRPIPV